MNYTKEQFKKDLKRYLKAEVHGGCATFNERGEKCEKCMFLGYCGYYIAHSYIVSNSFEIIEKVHNWAEAHPIRRNIDVLREAFPGEFKNDDQYDACTLTREWMNREYKTNREMTNREKFIEIFGSNPPFNTVEEFGKWLDEKYDWRK